MTCSTTTTTTTTLQSNNNKSWNQKLLFVLPTRYLLFVAFLLTSCWMSPTANACPICRTEERYLTNPNHEFTMVDTRDNTSYRWKCGYLALSVAHMDANGFLEEAFMCSLAQYWAEMECDCDGPYIKPLAEEDAYNPAPVCNMCRDSDISVPSILYDNLVQTGIGPRMRCGTLYDALAKGIVARDKCSIIQDNVFDACCVLPAIEPPVGIEDQDLGDDISEPGDETSTNDNDGDNGDLGDGDNGPEDGDTDVDANMTDNDANDGDINNDTTEGDDTEGGPQPDQTQKAEQQTESDPEPTCTDIHQPCFEGVTPDCCPGYECRDPGLGRTPTCRSPQTGGGVRGGRTSLGRGRGMGGAASRRRYGGGRL